MSGPRAAACVPDVHDRHHHSVTDQDIGGVEIGMDHVRCLSWWQDHRHTPSRERLARATAGECPRAWPRTGADAPAGRVAGIGPGCGRVLTGGDPPGVGPVVVGLTSGAWPAWSSMTSISCSARGEVSSGAGAASTKIHAGPHERPWPPLRARPGWDNRACAHVLCHSPGSQRLVQVAEGCARGTALSTASACPASRTRMAPTCWPPGQATDNSDLCPQPRWPRQSDLSRQPLGMGALVHRIEGPIVASSDDPISVTATGLCSANDRFAAAADPYHIESAASRAPIGPAIANEADERINLGLISRSEAICERRPRMSSISSARTSAERSGVRWVHPHKTASREPMISNR